MAQWSHRSSTKGPFFLDVGAVVPLVGLQAYEVNPREEDLHYLHVLYFLKGVLSVLNFTTGIISKSRKMRIFWYQENAGFY